MLQSVWKDGRTMKNGKLLRTNDHIKFAQVRAINKIKLLWPKVILLTGVKSTVCIYVCTFIYVQSNLGHK